MHERLYMQTFTDVLKPLHLLNHPFYQDWMQGTLSRDTLKDYAAQYYTHVKAFPRYISAIHSKTENEVHRKILLENLNDEEGLTHGVSHPDLWIQFGESLGLTKEDIQNSCGRSAIQNVVTTFFKYADKSFHEGLGALYAYESQVPEIAESKIEGLKSRYNITSASGLKFFEVHKTADVYHREAIENILNDLPADQKAEALEAAKVTAQSLWNFLSDTHKH